MRPFLKTLAVVATALFSVFTYAQAATQTFEVVADTHVGPSAGTPLATGISLAAGESFTVTADESDTWRLGGGPREGNANGLNNFPIFNSGGGSFLFGSLVGRIGAGDFFFIGTDFAGAASEAGELFLMLWDSNTFDNTGSIFATVATDQVPVPASAALLIPGLAALAMARRKKKAII